jgi:hypothetical protein
MKYKCFENHELSLENDFYKEFKTWRCNQCIEIFRIRISDLGILDGFHFSNKITQYISVNCCSEKYIKIYDNSKYVEIQNVFVNLDLENLNKQDTINKFNIIRTFI